jgi:hypothetical protein
MGSVAEIAWSELVAEADWIRDRLVTPVGSTVTSIIPGGFQAYARILHPAVLTGGAHDEPARWAQVAAWSGLELRANAQFHSVALPARGPASAELAACHAPPRTARPWPGGCGATPPTLTPAGSACGRAMPGRA